MPTMLFCNIARMDSYRGRTSVDVPHGAGSHNEKAEVHNFHPYGDHVYGYVAANNNSISLERLGADDRDQLDVGGVKLGVAASVRAAEWESARIYPVSPGSPLELMDSQQDSLRLFDASD